MPSDRKSPTDTSHFSHGSNKSSSENKPSSRDPSPTQNIPDTPAPDDQTISAIAAQIEHDIEEELKNISSSPPKQHLVDDSNDRVLDDSSLDRILQLEHKITSRRWNIS